MKMDKEKELPKRKSTRLKNFDYSSAGAYFVTICIKDRKRILSDIIKPVGVGAFDDPLTPQIQLTEIGKITEKYLLSSENIPGVKIDRYVVMPDHIHVIIFLYPDEYASHKDHQRNVTAYCFYVQTVLQQRNWKQHISTRIYRAYYS